MSMDSLDIAYVADPDEMPIEELLSMVAWCEADVEEAVKRLEPIKKAIEIITEHSKALVEYEYCMAELEEAKKKVVEYARQHLERSKQVPVAICGGNYQGWVIVTPKPDDVVVKDVVAFLQDPTTHRFVEKVILNKQGEEYFREHHVDGIALKEVPASVKMSVKSYLDSHRGNK